MSSILVRPTDLVADPPVRPFLESRRTRNKVAQVDRARLVAWYVERAQAGDPNPARTLAQRYPESSFKTWANVIHQARTQVPKLLTPAPRRGLAGGQLTEHAQRLIGLAPEESGVTAELDAAYQAGRERSQVRQGRVTEPMRSQFDSDDDYNRAWERWISRNPDAEDDSRYWHMESTDPDQVEDLEDWWNRVAAPSAPGPDSFTN